jgi:hypothetical protein
LSGYGVGKKILFREVQSGGLGPWLPWLLEQ